MSLEDFAVVAGLDRYSDFQHLQGANNDARRFHDWLIHPQGGGMQNLKTNISLVDVPDADHWQSTDPKPKSTDLEAAFRDLLGRAVMGQRPLGSRLFIFLAGHGFSDPDEVDEVALHSSESKLAIPSYLAATWYAREFRRIRAFEQIALITDCCRTASGLYPISRPQAIRLNSDPQMSQVKLFIAHATGFGTPAREQQNGGQAAGIFTSALIDALSNASPNHLGRLTGSLVKNYVHNNMAPGQTADIRVDTNKEFVFSETHQSATPPTGFIIKNHRGDETLFITDGTLTEIYREVASQPRVEVLLKPGLYKAGIEGSNRIYRFEIPSHDEIEI